MTIETDPVNARFVGGPFDGETHLLAHRLPFVQLPAPGEQFYARLLIEEPDAPDHLVYELVEELTTTVEAGGDPATPDVTIVYRCRADRR